MILAEPMNSSHNHLSVVVSGACSVRCLGGAPSRGLEQHVMSHPLVFFSFIFLLNHLDLEADKLHAGALEGPSRMGEVTNYFLRGLVRMCMCAQSLSCVQYFATPWTVACHAPLPGKNTVVAYHFILQGIFPTQEWNPCLLQWLEFIDSARIMRKRKSTYLRRL